MSETCRLLVCGVMYYGANSPTRLKRNRPPAIQCTKLNIHLKMEAVVYCRILPNLYHAVRRHNPKYVDLHSRRTGHLKYCTAANLFVFLYTGFRMAAKQNVCQRSAVHGRQLLRQYCTAVGLLSTVRRFKSKSIR
jgi:hypothetical protein